MASANTDSFISLFPIVVFYFLFCLIALIINSGTLWIGGERGYSHLVSDFRGYMSSFLLLNMMPATDFLDVLYQVDDIPFYF